MGGLRVGTPAASCGVPFIEAVAVSIVTEVGRYLADLTRDQERLRSVPLLDVRPARQTVRPHGDSVAWHVHDRHTG